MTLRRQRDIVGRRRARLSRRGRSGRPATHRKVRSVVLRLARENEDFYNTHRPHRTPNQAAPLRPPDGVTDLDHFRVRRRDGAGGVIHEYHLVAWVFGTHSPGLGWSSHMALGCWSCACSQ
jgi:hypothetical protein